MTATRAVFGRAMELLLLTALLSTQGVWCMQGPRLVVEPPRGRLDFSNSTGGVLECGAQGSPSPTLRWLTSGGADAEDVPGLRHVRASDGALVFLPFRADDYRAEVHDAPYTCAATNEVGTVLSNKVRVRGVVYQPYVVDVYDEFVVRGNTAVLRCRVPPQVQDYVSVTAWIRDESLVIRPTALAGDRFSIFDSGELHVRRVDRSDEMQQYRCETRHRLTGENVLSATAGRLLVTEAFREAAPRMTSSQRVLRAPLGSSLEAPCAAQGHPPPTYEWFRVSSPGSAPSPLPQPFGSRLLQLEGALLIRDLRAEDEGHYLCRATNAKGLAEAHTHILPTAPLSAQVSPPSAVVDVGRPASFNCSVSGRPVSGLVVEWMKDGRPLRPGQGVEVRQAGGVSLLRLSSVGRRDAGMYQCFVRNDIEDAAQATAQLALGDYPPTLLETFPEQQTLSPGSALSLRCVAQARPLPQITWTLYGAPLPESTRLRMGDYVRPGGHVVSYVNVSSVRPEDGGLYSCAAENAAGRAEHRGRTNVLGPPVVRPMPKVTAVAGDALWVTCPVGGYPIEFVRWEKDGVRVPLHHRQKTWPNGTLHVRDVDKSSDAGNYACIATNHEGLTAQGDMQVVVAVRPVIDPFSFPKSLSEGQRYSLLCTVTEGDPPIRISWTRPPSAGVRSVAVTPFSSTLVFDAVSPEQRGDYTCLAENRAGRTSHTATMVIHVPPRWRIEPSDTSATRDRPAVMDCQADGIPAPRIRWTKADGSPGEFRAISSSSRLQVLENGSLVVHSVQPQDAGAYLCQASNVEGQGISKLVHLSVHVSAHFESKFHRETVRRGEEARLVCAALGDRPLHLTWLKDKQTLEDARYELSETVSASSTSSTLTIRRADRRDSALYTCIAANAFGRDDTNIQLIVEELPDPPQDLKLLEVDSRTAKVGWTTPYTGNRPILQYVLHYKKQADTWQQRRYLNVTASESKAVLRGLTPTTRYHVRVVAENALGTGQPSNVVALATQQEAPGGPPLKVKAKGTGAHTIKVSWKAPVSDLQFGPIEGYYVGYRTTGSESPFVYKTLGPKEETQLTGLERLTEYQILVQAFNAKGASPPSEPVTGKTLQNDPPGSPSLKVTFWNATSIGLSWEQEDEENAVQGYVVHHRWELGEWQETEVTSGSDHAFHDLRCGSRYQFYVAAYNVVGRGAPSDTLRTQTQGRAPVAPDKQSLLSSNQTSAWVHLGAWSDGGCPISSFSVRYRPQRHQQWSSVGVTGPDVALEDLSPGTWYRLQVTARNEAGSTDAEYTFVTSHAHLSTGDVSEEEVLPLYLDVNILVPAAVSVAVLVALVALLCLIAHKKPRTNTAHAGSLRSVKSGVCESLPMSEKNSLKKALSATGYYPTPYATTRISSEKQVEEPLYATVKRTPRPPRSDLHVYHYPGEMPEFLLQCKGVDELGAASSSSVYWKDTKAPDHASVQRYSER